MRKKIKIILSVIIIVVLCILLIHRYSQYILVWQANKKISVYNIKLMMPETEVKIIIGEEESYIPGFGGYRLEYPSKDVFLTFLNDDDTDFHHKVNRIEVTGSKYEVFGINVGHKFNDAVDILHKQGFKQGQDDSFSYYWRGTNLYITLGKNYDKVQKITIGVRDRVASTRVY
jgi:hypothetical protein